MLTFHLWMCKYCKRFKSQLLILRNAARLEEMPEDDAERSASLPPAARVRIKQALKDFSS